MPTTVSALCSKRRDRDGDLPDRRRLGVDLEHQLAGARAVVEGEREPLRVREHVAAQVEHHRLVELGVDVVVHHAEGRARGR